MRRGRVRSLDRDHTHVDDRTGAEARGEMTQVGKVVEAGKAKASQVGTKVTGAKARGQVAQDGQVARDGQEQAVKKVQVGQVTKDGQAKVAKAAQVGQVAQVGQEVKESQMTAEQARTLERELVAKIEAEARRLWQRHHPMLYTTAAQNDVMKTKEARCEEKGPNLLIQVDSGGPFSLNLIELAVVVALCLHRGIRRSRSLRMRRVAFGERRRSPLVIQKRNHRQLRRAGRRPRPDGLEEKEFR